MPDVLVSEEVGGPALDALRAEFDVAVEPALWREAEALRARAADCRALVVRNQTRVTRELIGAAGRLEIVARAGVGLDNIDVPAATEAGVVVAYAPEQNAISVAELSMGMLLALARRLTAADRSTRAGGWERQAFTGVELYGKTVGIVGFGRIGFLLAMRARAFGMRVLAHDPYVSPDAVTVSESGAELVGLDLLLARADVVSCHLPSTPETRGFFDARRFALMKPSAYFLNLARGEVVDEAALADALRAGRVAGAGLDVRAVEPPAPSPLDALDNVVLTPPRRGVHRRGAGARGRGRVPRRGRGARRAPRRVLRQLRGAPPAGGAPRGGLPGGAGVSARRAGGAAGGHSGRRPVPRARRLRLGRAAAAGPRPRRRVGRGGRRRRRLGGRRPHGVRAKPGQRDPAGGAPRPPRAQRRGRAGRVRARAAVLRQAPAARGRRPARPAPQPGRRGATGLVALPVAVVCIGVALVVVGGLTRALGLPPKLGTLTAVGTSICGVTAIVAAAPVIEAADDETSYAVATIALFGTLALFTYPFLAHLLFADPRQAGLFLGTAIHDTSQVAGAGLTYQQQFRAPAALDAAVVTKLVRNLCMVGVIPLVRALHRRRAPTRAPDGAPNESGRAAAERAAPKAIAARVNDLVPLFILGFVAAAALRTVGDLGGRPFGVVDPAGWRSGLALAQRLAEVALLLAMAAVGLGTGLQKLRELGLRPLAVGFAAAACVGTVSAVLIRVLDALAVV
jgi:phosphoglycerate dehydrogenase-like enzyme/uncharacterized membrane protein YadS